MNTRVLPLLGALTVLTLSAARLVRALRKAV